MSADDLEPPPLARIELARRLAELDRLAPSRELDERVLARARAAIGASAPTTFYRSPRWALAFALVALLVIGCALILVARGSGPRRVALESTVPQAPAAHPSAAPGSGAAAQESAGQGSGSAREPGGASRQKQPRAEHGSQ
jgi:hypothetical protein